MNLVFFDDAHTAHLYPLTLTRPNADLRIGVLTLSEKWCLELQGTASFRTLPYLSQKYPEHPSPSLLINGRWLPDDNAVAALKALPEGGVLIHQDLVLAYRCTLAISNSWIQPLQPAIPPSSHTSIFPYDHPVKMVKQLSDVFSLNAGEIVEDFHRLTKGKNSAPLSPTNTVIGSHPVFLASGASAECAIFNTTEGPIYLDAHSEVMEGSMIRGPFALGAHSQIKMGARIYTGTTVGPYCKIGGEVSNSVIWGYSNKAHEGFLGNSVIGQWCNLGADSNNSNLKNNYEEVKLWSYATQRFEKTGLQFCGLIMGDHSKCGINTMFNTGTVVGVSANIFGAGFPRNFIPDFSWGGASGFVTYKLDAAFKTAEKVFERRNLVFNDTEKQILAKVFEDWNKE